MPDFGQEIFVQAQAHGPLTDQAYREARAEALRLAGPDGLSAALDANHLDAVVGPTAGPASLSDPVLGDHFVGGGAGSIAAVAGTPSVTVPAGAVRGLPVVIVFMGRAYAEPELLALA